MTRVRISTGSPFEVAAGYSRAIVDGDWVFVSGTTGYDYTTMTMPSDVESQARNAFQTIAQALQDAGASVDDVVRARYHITDRAYADTLFNVTGEVFGDVRPAATLTICDLLDPEMLVEIEVTARKSAR